MDLIKLAAVTKRVTFACSHFLTNPAWSQEENVTKFHKCSLYKSDDTEEPHGHNYVMEVTVFGIIDTDTGFVIDFKELKRILNEGIVERLDHRLINNISYFKDHVTTVENILQYVWEEIAPQINALRPGKAQLVKIKIWETEDSCAELTVKDIEWQNHVQKQQQAGTVIDKQENGGCQGNCNCKNQGENNG